MAGISTLQLNINNKAIKRHYKRVKSDSYGIVYKKDKVLYIFKYIILLQLSYSFKQQDYE